MIEEPTRLLDTIADDLSDLRTALREAGALRPTEPALEQLNARVQAAMLPPSEVPLMEDAEDYDAADIDPASFDPNARHSLSVAIETAEADSAALAEVEPDVASGLTASLLAAGAAIVWLRRRGSESAVEDDPEDDDQDA